MSQAVRIHGVNTPRSGTNLGTPRTPRSQGFEISYTPTQMNDDNLSRPSSTRSRVNSNGIRQNFSEDRTDKSYVSRDQLEGFKYQKMSQPVEHFQDEDLSYTDRQMLGFATTPMTRNSSHGSSSRKNRHNMPSHISQAHSFHSVHSGLDRSAMLARPPSFANNSFDSIADTMLGDQFDTASIISKHTQDDELTMVSSLGPGSLQKSTSGESGRSSRKMLIQTSLASGKNARTKKKQSSKKLMSIPRELYDAYAPPGPLGIVIDTTSDGPVVHSMKTNSPLINLIQIADVIVSIDDIDTRCMNAATLTRLMARKSQQPQRKITLLNMDR